MVAVIVLLLSAPAMATPWGPASGTQIELWDNSSTMSTNIDGIFLHINTPGDMDVPLSGTNNQPSAYPNGKTIIGNNTRPVQIVAMNNAQARDRVEFVAIGITAGCQDDDRQNRTECTGTTQSNNYGGVYKKVYVEHLVKRYSGDPVLFEVAHYDALSVNWNRTYQIQRKHYLGDYHFMTYFQSNNKQNVPVLDFVSGIAVFGTESVTRNYPECCQAPQHQRLNQWVDDFSGISYHRHGQASASPPGTTNYTGINYHRVDNPHSSYCSMSGWNGYGFVVNNGERC